MQNTYKKNYIGRFLIFVIGLALVLAVSFVCAHYIEKQTEKELWANINDVAQENSINIQNQIEAKYNLVKALAKEVENSEGLDITKFHSFVESYNLRRLGYCDAEGMCYATSGEVTDLSFREFYQRAMKGLNTISGILFDAMNDDRAHLNIMTVPTYDDLGAPNGLVGITYETENFNDSLRIVVFDRQGGCFAINEKNEVVVAKGNVPYHLADVIWDANILSNVNTSGIMERGGEEYFYQATKLSMMEGDVIWKVFTIVPTYVLTARTQKVHTALLILNIVLVLTVIVGIFIYVLVTRGQRKALQALAYEDPLTHGPNLAAFLQNLSDRKNHEGSFVHMDIRNFGLVNITLGKEQGDGIIRASWSIVKRSLGENDTAARVKDDNFIIFYADPDKSRAVVRMRKISNEIAQMTATRKLSGVVPSFGIYISSEADFIEEAYQKAIIAADIAKNKVGTDRVFYDEIDHERLRLNEELEGRFEEALNDKEFRVWYQPKYRASDEVLVGAEALIRWIGKDGKMVMPGLFIPLFESDGKIAELDEYVFREVCTQIKKWCDEGKNVVPVSINLSRASLFHSDVLAKYLTILVKTDVDPNLIQLEITESAMNGRSNIREILEKLRANGIKILMDDFGTGYSALSTLNSGCFDVLKVDKSLVDDIGTERGETLLHCVIDMGHQLGLSITAEGVEEKVQLEFLRQKGCDDIQGYYFSKPLPMEDFEKILE